MMDKKRIEELAAQHAGGVLISRYAVGEMIQALQVRAALAQPADPVGGDVRALLAMCVGPLNIALAMAEIHSNADSSAETAKQCHDALAGIDAILSRTADSGKVAEGWKMVPVEPTQAMLAAADRTVPDVFNIGDEYRAMVKAAPAADSAATEQACEHDWYATNSTSETNNFYCSVCGKTKAVPRAESAAELVACQHDFRHCSGTLFRRCIRCDDIEVSGSAAAPASADVGELTDGKINEITLDKLGKWPSFEAQSWACKVVHVIQESSAALPKDDGGRFKVRVGMLHLKERTAAGQSYSFSLHPDMAGFGTITPGSWDLYISRAALSASQEAPK